MATGAVQFQNDWPGLFIRGDDAISLGRLIRTLEERVGENSDPGVIYALIKLGEIAKIIEEDVKGS